MLARRIMELLLRLQSYVALSFFQWPLFALSLALFIRFLFLRLATNPNSFSSRKQFPPGPKPLPLIGSIHELGDKPHHDLARLAKSYGPLISLRLGMVTTIVVSSPDVARDFLQKHDVVFASRFSPDAIHACDHSFASVVWLPPAKQWRALRRLCTNELMSMQRLDALQLLRQQKLHSLVDYVAHISNQGKSVGIGQVMFSTTLNLLSQTIFSVDFVDLDDHTTTRGFKNLITEIMETAGKPNISDCFPLIATADIQGIRRHLERLFRRLHCFFDEQIEGRLKCRAEGKATKNDFLDVLLDYKFQEDGSKLDRTTLRSLFTDLFAAGTDTTASTVEWAMAELLQNPQSLHKVQKELVEAIPAESDVQELDITHLPYLQAVVKETLRKHPPVPLLLPRQAQQTMELRGYTIPKGARVLVNVWAMGRDDKIWVNPEKFDPERFIEKELGYHGRDFELIPFGAGRRICVGLPLAHRMIHLALATLLRHFAWRLPEEVEKSGMDMSELFGITLCMSSPIHAIATPIGRIQ